MKTKVCPKCNNYVTFDKYDVYRDSAGGHVRCKICRKEIHVTNADIAE